MFSTTPLIFNGKRSSIAPATAAAEVYVQPPPPKKKFGLAELAG